MKDPAKTIGYMLSCDGTANDPFVLDPFNHGVQTKSYSWISDRGAARSMAHARKCVLFQCTLDRAREIAHNHDRGLYVDGVMNGNPAGIK